MTAETPTATVSQAPSATTSRATAPEDQAAASRRLYLDLLIRVLTGELFKDPPEMPGIPKIYDAGIRTEGLDWPARADSMIGLKRMASLCELCERVIDDQVPGDFIETGVWRGGACILMRAVLEAHGVRDRTVWVADSFAGLPPADPEHYPAETVQGWHTFRELAVDLETVQENFRKYGLLDGQVRFLKGWFKDTLPVAPIDRLAIARLDGDMYESTRQALEALYPKLQPGGFLIVDDFGSLEPCRTAVMEYRSRHRIEEPIEEIDTTGVFWRRRAT